MEHRKDLEELLLGGLPADEREQVVKAMSKATTDHLTHKRLQDRDRPVDQGET